MSHLEKAASFYPDSGFGFISGTRDDQNSSVTGIDTVTLEFEETGDYFTVIKLRDDMAGQSPVRLKHVGY